MKITEVTSREFRDKQKAYFDKADQGEKIIIKRRNNKSYVLTPVDEDDLYFTPKMIEKIEKSIQEAKEGKVTRLTPELRKELFGE